MIQTLLLPQDLRAQILREAEAAYPRECCGLIEGRKEGAAVKATACHPVRNIAETAGRFELDPAQHIGLLRALRGTGRKIVGCYHSHPNGQAKPSALDRENAADDDFLWLIAGSDALCAFVHKAGAFYPVRLA